MSDITTMTSEHELTGAEVERISTKNRNEWLDAIDDAELVADELDLLIMLMALMDTRHTEFDDNVVNGAVNILMRASDTIRKLGDLVASHHPSPYRHTNQMGAVAGTDGQAA